MVLHNDDDEPEDDALLLLLAASCIAVAVADVVPWERVTWIDAGYTDDDEAIVDHRNGLAIAQ